MELDIKGIQEIIPTVIPFARGPDRRVGGRKARSRVKNVTVNEPFFQGHFPEYPVMPGVLIVEALAQVGAVAVLGMEENRGKLAFFAGIDKFRFRGQV